MAYLVSRRSLKLGLWIAIMFEVEVGGLDIVGSEVGGSVWSEMEVGKSEIGRSDVGGMSEGGGWWTLDWRIWWAGGGGGPKRWSTSTILYLSYRGHGPAPSTSQYYHGSHSCKCYHKLTALLIISTNISPDQLLCCEDDPVIFCGILWPICNGICMKVCVDCF